MINHKISSGRLVDYILQLLVSHIFFVVKTVLYGGLLASLCNLCIWRLPEFTVSNSN